MRFTSAFDGAVPDFTVTCAGYRASRRKGTGALSFILEDKLLAELCDSDLAESWQAAQDLDDEDARELSRSAGEHLSELLDAGLGAVDLSEAVTDAAVVFLLAMRRYGVVDPKRIPACSVMWHGQGAYERVVLGA